MLTLLIYSITLLLAVLLSELADRTILSAAAIFLVVGFLAGAGVLGVVTITPDHPLVRILADLALFAVLFTDGIRAGLADVATAWRLPGRALLFGLPLTWLGTAVLAHVIAGTSWLEGLLVGAILSPTDPVFAAAIVGREEIPACLQGLLNVESGLNDGLALPLVMAFLAVLGAPGPGVFRLVGELALGIAIGVLVPWGAIRVERSRFFAVARRREPAFAFAVGLLLYAVTRLTGANEYLAAFAAGVTIATCSPRFRDEFEPVGRILSGLLKLAAVFVFGALISPAFLAAVPPSGYAFALAALLIVRPAALAIALVGEELTWPEWVAAAWFGPKGFASVVYGLLLLAAAIPHADALFHLVAVVVGLSILAHSSTDVVVASWFRRSEGDTGGIDHAHSETGEHDERRAGGT
jgi:sodium/hydrogen antiporter